MPQALLVATDELAGMILPTRAALLSIDVRRDFAAPDGAARTWAAVIEERADG